MLLRGALALLVAACFLQPSLSNGSELGQRLAAVAYRILASNTDLCGRDTHAVLGIEASFGSNGRTDEPDAKDYLIVLSATRGAPAAKGGIEAGDRITEVNGEALPSGPDGLRLLLHWLNDHQDALLRLGVERGGATEYRVVHATPACSYDVVLADDGRMDAVTQEQRVTLTSGMVDWLANDDDLATVVGHEIAHIAAGHTRSELGLNDDEIEAEADYIGVYLAARAGYNILGAADLLKRIVASRAMEGGEADPRSIALRLQAIGKAVDDIRRAGTAAALPQALFQVLHSRQRPSGSLG